MKKAWRLEPNGAAWNIYEGDYQIGIFLGMNGQSAEEIKRHATLMVSSPELLEACKQLLKDNEEANSRGVRNDGLQGTTILMAYDAVVRATGE